MGNMDNLSIINNRKNNFVVTSKVKGFTLVELLVVIAVISILAGMLMPALENAIIAGHSIACKNNLKQCSLALFSYSSDYNDYMPRPYTGGMIWSERLEYAGLGEGMNDSFHCPTFAPDDYTAQWTYGMTQAPSYHGATWKWYSYRLNDLAKGPGVNPSGSFPYSKVPILMDSISSVGGTKEWYRTYCTCATFTTSQIHCRHGWQANVLFLDTHVENVDVVEPTEWEWHPHLATEQ